MSLGIIFAGECLQHIPEPQSTVANIEYLVVDFPRFQVLLGKVSFEISKNLTVAIHINSYNSHGAGRGWCHPSRHGRGVLYSVKVDAWIGLLRVGAKFA